jgi:hypothetical protein
MEYKGNYWLTYSQIVIYQICENPFIQLEVIKTINPATLLPIDSGPLEHDCLEVMDEVFSSQLDLTDQPISHLDIEYFTDGSSFVPDGTRFARYAVVTLDAVIDAHSLPVWTSAQKAELIAPTWVLQLAAGVQVNIYMDSKYVFTIINMHGALYKERGLITWEEKVLSMDKKFWDC